jgi:transglutaminase-like putative cysteine protease
MATATVRAPNQSQLAIERFFQTSLYLLVLSGFMLLASTGRLDVLSLLVVSAALLMRGALLLRGRDFTIPEQWTNYFTIGYVAFYAIDYLFLSRTFIGATVHLTLFSMAVKLFGVYRERDNIYLALLAFGMVLSGAVLTVDSTFFFALAFFLLLATATFISMEMRRSARQSTVWAREHGGDDRNLRAALSVMTLVLLLGVLASAVGLFFALPRRAGGYLSAFAPRNQFISGFSDTVELGQIGQIQQSSIVVMHVNIAGDTSGRHELLWRGVALNLFDGIRWQSQENFSIITSRFHSYDLQSNYEQSEGLEGAVRPPAALLRYTVSMDPVGTNVFFLAAEPRQLRGDYGPLSMDFNGSLFNNGTRGMITSYEATSAVPLAGAKELAAAGREFPTFVTLNYLQLPKLDPRVRDLARQVTSAAQSDYEKAAAIEGYLQSTYSYTLDQGTNRPEDPIAHFLFERKKGHCEYFASSMAVMLRTLGIPSRIVNGFRGGEFNDLTDSYIVRARDAHSWVEAYFPGYGWVQFDPTPASALPANTRWNRAMLYLDAAREFWREWVVNYDFIHQMDVSRRADELGRRFFLKADLRWKNFYRSIVDRARHARERISPTKSAGLVVLVVAGLIILFNLRKIAQSIRRSRLAKDPGSAPMLAASIWYERMTTAVSKRGWRKTPAQTPGEFIGLIEDPELRKAVERFTERYHRARFGDSAPDAMELPQLYEEISASKPK